MIYLDAGTTYSKLIELYSNSLMNTYKKYYIKSVDEKHYYILPSSIIKNRKLSIAKCCGHMSAANVSENEIIALAAGSEKIVDKNALILDLGSRDAKWIRFKSGKFHDMDWNTSCASSTGATVEMLLKFYNIKSEELVFNKEKFTVTCGIFGLEKIMDDISGGTVPADAISKFVHGIAYNVWKFAQKPSKLYLSGGFCENGCFMNSLGYYCEVIPLGRFILCDGLLNLEKEAANAE